jgi:MHS family proline/betaine transporter-like MFS transporter
MHPSPNKAAHPWRVIAATSLGNGLELFDFTVYSFFAALIGRLFFPVGNDMGSLMLSMGTFGAGFVVRPLGSIVIGRYADKVGRKPAMSLTIGLMALGTALIGLTPTYAHIGLIAPLMILLGRLLQGFSAGGEVGTSTSFLMESASTERRGFLVSWQMASQGAAALVAALCCFALVRTLSPDQLESWGWRVPFWLGLLIGPVGFYIRRHLNESHAPAAGEQAAHAPLWATLKSQRGAVLRGIMLMISGTSMTYVVIFFMPSYLGKILGMGLATSFMSGCVAGAAMAIVSPLAGLLTDKLGQRQRLLKVTMVCGLLATYPTFALLNSHPGLSTLLPVVALLVGLMALSSTPGLLLILESFPAHARATGLGVVYSVGVTVFGGFAQLIVTWLISVTGSAMAPAWYLMGCQVISLIGLWLYGRVSAPVANEDTVVLVD